MGLKRFERIALLFSSGAALGAYQAGATAALLARGLRPNWIAGSEIGAINAAILAGNPSQEAAASLRRFWQELSSLWASRPRRRARRPLFRRFARGEGEGAFFSRANGALRALLADALDCERINGGSLRLVLGAHDRGTGRERTFDNDRHRLGLDHILACLPPADLEAGSLLRAASGVAVPLSALIDAPPADTLSFLIDGYDPIPQRTGGLSRAARDIASLKRNHELRRMIALLGEHLEPSARRNPDVLRCLEAASSATMTLLHLVHEEGAGELSVQMGDFSHEAVARRWQAGESDVAASFAQPLWLQPRPPLSAAVVHELRRGAPAPPP